MTLGSVQYGRSPDTDQAASGQKQPLGEWMSLVLSGSDFAGNGTRLEVSNTDAPGEEKELVILAPVANEVELICETKCHNFVTFTAAAPAEFQGLRIHREPPEFDRVCHTRDPNFCRGSVSCFLRKRSSYESVVIELTGRRSGRCVEFRMPGAFE